MHKYIADFLECGRDDKYVGSTKTYFPPWWKFWGRKVKTEIGDYNSLIREFDQNGNMIHIMRRKSRLNMDGFGEKFYWENLDLKTLTVTSQPYSSFTRTISPQGDCKDVYEPDEKGIQRIVLGHISNQGDNKPYVSVFLKNGKQIEYRWMKKVTSAAIERLKKLCPLSMDEKVDILEKASKDFRAGKKVPETEAELRKFKNDEAKARVEALKARHSRAIVEKGGFKDKRLLNLVHRWGWPSADKR